MTISPAVPTEDPAAFRPSASIVTPPDRLAAEDHRGGAAGDDRLDLLVPRNAARILVDDLRQEARPSASRTRRACSRVR